MGISWLSEGIHFELHGDHKDVSECNVGVEVSDFYVFQN
jgi:hypothetical protein